MQTLAAEHKSSYEKIEADLQTLQEDYAALEKELEDKRGPEDRDVRKLREQLTELQAELQQMEFEKVDLEDQVESLKRDAAQLIEKDGKVARERADERKNLQAVLIFAEAGSNEQEIEELQIQFRETLEQHARNIEEYEKEVHSTTRGSIDGRPHGWKNASEPPKAKNPISKNKSKTS